MSRKSKLEADFAKDAAEHGWFVQKTHGDAMSSGWPDFWVFHPEHGWKAVEIKSKNDKLTAAQFERFSKWHERGAPVWVITEPRISAVLRLPVGNVAEWIAKGPKVSASRRKKGWHEQG